jgi:hypothetical protein
MLKLKNTHLENLNVPILASISVPFRPTTVQMPNLALFETKRITVCGSFGLIWTTEPVGQSIFLSRRRQVDIIIYYKYPIHVGIIVYIAGKLRFPSVLLPTTEKFDPSHSVLERDTCFFIFFKISNIIYIKKGYQTLYSCLCTYSPLPHSRTPCKSFPS